MEIMHVWTERHSAFDTTELCDTYYQNSIGIRWVIIQVSSMDSIKGQRYHPATTAGLNISSI